MINNYGWNAERTKTAKSTMARAFPPLYSHKLNKKIFHWGGGAPSAPLNPPLKNTTRVVNSKYQWARLKFWKVGQKSRSRPRGQKLLYEWKGLVTRNTHMKFESPIWHCSQVMSKVKVFVYGRRRQRQRRRGYDNSSLDIQCKSRLAKNDYFQNLLNDSMRRVQVKTCIVLIHYSICYKYLLHL